MEKPDGHIRGEGNADRAARGEYWRGHVENCGKSGLSQKGYCVKAGISIERFGYWKRRFERESGSCAGKLVAVPSGIVSSALSGVRGMLGIVVRERYRIEVPERFSPDTLAAVLEVLNRL